MDSKVIDQMGLKHLWLLKKITARFLVVLSNVYEFTKENSGDLKTTTVSEENTGVSNFGPVYEKLSDLAEQFILFIDDTFDKYASSVAKNIVANLQSLIYGTKPLLKTLLIIAQTVITPIITITIFLLKLTKYLIQDITTTKSASLVDKSRTPLQKGLTTTQTLLQSNPLVGATQSILQNSLNATKTLVPDNILQKSPDLANTAQETTKSLLGGIPLVGNVTQSLATNPTDLASQIANKTNSLVNENPYLEAVNSATPSSLDTTKSLAKQTQNKTKSLFGGIPLVGNVAESLVTGPATLANQIVNKTNSIVNENPILEAVNSAAQSSLDATKSLAPNNILQMGSDLVNQAQDTTKSLVGGVPLVGDIAQSIVTNPTDLANQIVNTTNSLLNGNPLLGAVNSAAQNIGLKPQATGTKAALQSAYLTLKLAWIPVIAQLWYEVVNKYPWVGELSEFIFPLVVCVCKLYNQIVKYMDGKDFSIFGYLPLVPIDEMKVAYKLVETSRDSLSAVGDLLGMNNNKGLSAVGDLLGVK